MTAKDKLDALRESLIQDEATVNRLWKRLRRTVNTLEKLRKKIGRKERVEAQDIEQRHHWLTQQVGGLQSYLEAVRMLDTYQRDRDGLKAAEDGGERIIRYLGYDLVPHVKDGQWWFTVRDHCELGQQRTHPQVHMTVSRTDPDVAFREAQEWVDEQPAF